MKNGKKTTIIKILIILVIGVIFFAYKNDRKLYKEEINRNKMFAIMIEKGDGKYIEYRSKKWPEYGYKYNKEKTKCVDRDRKDIGNIIEYDARINEATMKSRRSAYCTLYFDIDKIAPVIQDASFYIGKYVNQEYTNNRNEEIHIKIDDDDVIEYCLLNEKDSDKCEWKALPELDENNWFVTTEHTLTEGDGTKVVYLYLKDGAKNISEEKEASIILDQTEPECRIDGESTTWIKGNRTISWGCSDSGSGCIEEKVNVGSYEYTNTARQVTIVDYEIEDKAGNKKDCNGVKANVYIDKKSPTLTITNTTNGSAYNGSWTKYDVNTKFEYSDDHSKINKDTFKYSTNGKDWTLLKYDDYEWKAERNETIYIKICDNVDNCTEKSFALKIDKTAPSCSISGNPTTWQKTNATLTQNGTDSGEGTVYYSWDNKNSYSTTKSSKSVSSNGTYTLYVKDGAANETSCNVSVTKIDKDGPNLTITNKVDGKAYNGSWTNKNISSKLSFSDGGAGIDASSLKWKAEGTNAKDWASISNTSTTEYSDTWSNEREGTAYYKICDKLENCTTKSFAIKIDKTAPTIEFSLDGQTAKYTCSNGGSGSPLTGTKTGSQALSGTSNYKYEVTCKDEAGNSKTDSHTYTYDSCLSSSCNEGWSYYGCFVAYSTSSNCRANCAGSCYEEDSDEYGGGISGSWICKLCKYWDNCAATTCVGGFKY